MVYDSASWVPLLALVLYGIVVAMACVMVVRSLPRAGALQVALVSVLLACAAVNTIVPRVIEMAVSGSQLYTNESVDSIPSDKDDVLQTYYTAVAAPITIGTLAAASAAILLSMMTNVRTSPKQYGGMSIWTPTQRDVYTTREEDTTTSTGNAEAEKGTTTAGPPNAVPTAAAAAEHTEHTIGSADEQIHAEGIPTSTSGAAEHTISSLVDDTHTLYHTDDNTDETTTPGGTPKPEGTRDEPDGTRDEPDGTRDEPDGTRDGTGTTKPPQPCPGAEATNGESILCLLKRAFQLGGLLTTSTLSATSWSKTNVLAKEGFFVGPHGSSSIQVMRHWRVFMIVPYTIAAAAAVLITSTTM
jgi:hypothetical protein